MAFAPLLLLAASAFAAQRPAYSPRRLALMRTVTTAEGSEDGKTAYFVTDITGALELWSVPAEGGWPAQLTDLGEQVSEPTLSADGKYIAFASDYGGDERPDLFLVSATGGETFNVTRSTRAETSPAFSPDDARLAFLADPGAPFLFQLFVMDLATKKEVQLTREKENVHFPTWSPDGKTIAVTRSGDDRSGPLLLVAADGSGRREIPPPVEGGILVPQDWSEDGSRLLCLAEDEEGFHRLYLLDPATGTGRFLGPGGWPVEHAQWSKKAGIVFTRDEAGVSALYRLKSPDSKPEQLLAPRGRIDSFDVDRDGRDALLVWSDSAHAQDVWRADLKKGTMTQVTRSMLGGVDPDALAPGRIIEYPSEGRTIRAVYLQPKVARLGSPPPLIVQVHGGPDWQSYDDFQPERQALAEAGFAVLAPNYRGSDGFGRKFLDANHKDWGGGDRRDLINGAKFLAARGEIDPKRVGITGGSFGGYSTLYALARNDGTWAAGVAAYGMPDLALDYELSKSRFAPWYEVMMGNPKDDAALFKERSAITYLQDLKAPLLIFQGANDTNVPLAEAKLIYKRLSRLGRDVSLVVYPDEGHGFSRRKNLADYYEKTVDFFKAKLGRP